MSKPDDPALLTRRGVTAKKVSDPDAQSYYLVIYYLGSLSIGNRAGASSVGDYLAKKAPNSPYLRQILNTDLNEPCKTCRGLGKTERPCVKSNGKNCGGTCVQCKGQRSINGGFGQSFRCGLCQGTGRCKACDGKGTVIGTCPACSGARQVLSKKKIQAAYKIWLSSKKPTDPEIKRKLAMEKENRRQK